MNEYLPFEIDFSSDMHPPLDDREDYCAPGTQHPAMFDAIDNDFAFDY
jgi:hypothetical protein